MAEKHPHVLLTGATGFVGRNLYPVLRKIGLPVRCLTRNPERAERSWPGRQWIGGDLSHAKSLGSALSGCAAAFYLVHSMGAGGSDFRSRELEAADRFARTAAVSGVQRIVYLGGMRPGGDVSEHLRSRLEVGELLRAGEVPTLELRASMIVGHGSLSWLIVRDLAARLPFMVLPSWLNSRTQPVALADVLEALRAALELTGPVRGWWDLPGPDPLSAKEILLRIAAVMQRPRPLMIDVPVLSPWLSSHWVRFVTRAEWSVAREVVVGLKNDMLAHDASFWQRTGQRLVSFDEAARQALQAEVAAGPVPGGWGRVERWLARRPPNGASA